MFLCHKNNKEQSIMQEKRRKSEVLLLKLIENLKYNYYFLCNQ